MYQRSAMPPCRKKHRVRPSGRHHWSNSSSFADHRLRRGRLSRTCALCITPSDGIVGPEVAVQGDVIKHGDHLMHVYVGRKYAIVYLETGTLYATAVGDRVGVADGFSESGGTVTEILPLSKPLPNEFQKAFRAPTRGQIAKIALDDETVF